MTEPSIPVEHDSDVIIISTSPVLNTTCSIRNVVK